MPSWRFIVSRLNTEVKNPTDSSGMTIGVGDYPGPSFFGCLNRRFPIWWPQILKGWNQLGSIVRAASNNPQPIGDCSTFRLVQQVWIAMSSRDTHVSPNEPPVPTTFLGPGSQLQKKGCWCDWVRAVGWVRAISRWWWNIGGLIGNLVGLWTVRQWDG